MINDKLINQFGSIRWEFVDACQEYVVSSSTEVYVFDFDEEAKAYKCFCDLVLRFEL